MISVAMTTYNGEKYLRRQIDSVLVQLESTDELIISDDGSSDSTLSIIYEYQTKHSNIRYFKNENHGIAGNFNNALEHCNGEIIYLCDQDDYWYPSKISVVNKVFLDNPDVLVVMHDDRLVNEQGMILKDSFKDRTKHGLIANIVKSSYYGHRIAFRKSFMSIFMPIPSKCKLYDQYIGLCAERSKKVLFIDQVLTDYLTHDNNYSKDRVSIYERILVRWNLVYSFAKSKLDKTKRFHPHS